MRLFERLQNETVCEREYLMAAPLIDHAINQTITLEEYVAYLHQAYHHVRHTTPLLMAVGSRIPADKEWLRDAVAEYIEEELGHQEWILNDIAACGYDKEQARHSTPNLETELMIAYAYDRVTRVNPIGFFGMVHVLEGTSVNIADQAADAIQQHLGLPNKAFTYLRSHGSLDQEHVQFFESLMDRITDPDEQAQIVHCAKVFYRLFGDVLRSVDANQLKQLNVA